MTKTSADWTFAGIWNKSLEVDIDKREVEPRDYLWASEIGKPEVDIWLRMKGVEPTNPPNPRSLRKFEAGNLWEWIVQLILLRSGIMHDSQVRVKHKYDGLLEVSGKIDFLAGGDFQFDKAKDMMEVIQLPPRVDYAMKQIISYLQDNYPDGLTKKAMEIKSVSSFVMNACEITEKPMEGHLMQAYHYTKHPDVDRTDLVYICRDDCRMMTFPILENHSIYEEKYFNYIKTYSENYLKEEMPKPANPIEFSESEGRFSLNRQIGWSGYLSLVYGFESQMEFENKYKSLPAGWNAVLRRKQKRLQRDNWLAQYGCTDDDVIKEKLDGQKTARTQFVVYEGKKMYMPEELWVGYDMTEKNEEAIKSMKEYGYDADDFAQKLVDVPEEEGVDNTS